MKDPEAPDLTPLQPKTVDKSSQDQKDPRMFFITAALNMSWQLAAVVLVPVVVGVELDKHYKTTPVFTLVGFALAIMGIVVVMRRVLQEYSPKHEKSSKK